MLVLSRKKGETFFIGGREIAVTVVDIRGDKCRLGITAPRGVSVHRSEVQDAIDREEMPPRLTEDQIRNERRLESEQ